MIMNIHALNCNFWTFQFFYNKKSSVPDSEKNHFDKNDQFVFDSFWLADFQRLFGLEKTYENNKYYQYAFHLLNRFSINNFLFL